MPHILLLGTCDTKLEELLFTRRQIIRHPDASVTLIDVGRSPVQHPHITISQSELTKYAPQSLSDKDVSSLSRGEVNKYMASCASAYVKSLFEASTPVHGIISLGGSGGTSLAAAVMRDVCPLGFPKLIVSTIASGDTSSFVGSADITLMPSIVDIAGLNSLLRNILSNAAGAIFGAASAYSLLKSEAKQEQEEHTKSPAAKLKIRIGITMFGVTTPCVDTIRAYLSSLSSKDDCPYDFEPFVFHATGIGGLAMEQLISSSSLDAVLDITTTEICDYVVDGGIMSAGPSRLSAAIEKKIPTVISLGATDMVNFGPKTSIPKQYTESGRTFFEHNPSISLMRTSKEDCRKIGEFIVDKLKGTREEGICEVWIPKGGVSSISEEGGVFEDREADQEMFVAIEEGLKSSKVKIVEDHRAINDAGFARGCVDALIAMLNSMQR